MKYSSWAFGIIALVSHTAGKPASSSTTASDVTQTLIPSQSSAASALEDIWSLQSAAPKDVQSAQDKLPDRLESDFLFNPTAASVTSYLGSLPSDVASGLQSLGNAEASIITSIYSTPTVPNLHIHFGDSATSGSSSLSTGGSTSQTSSASAAATSATPTGAAAGQTAMLSGAMGGLAVGILGAAVFL